MDHKKNKILYIENIHVKNNILNDKSFCIR